MLRVVVALLLALAFATGATTPPAAQEIQSPEPVVDYFDGLRAWELGERATAVGMWSWAAEHGDRRAMRRLAELYERADELPQDFALAYFWFMAANRAGDSSSEADANRVAERLEDASRNAVIRALAEWHPRAAAETVRVSVEAAERASAFDDALLALGSGNPDALRQIIEASPEVAEAVGPDGNTLLHHATAVGDPTSLGHVLARVRNKNRTNQAGLTALHIAASRGDVPSIRALIAAGAAAYFETAGGISAAEIARARGHARSADLLVSASREQLSTFVTHAERTGLTSAAFYEDQDQRMTAVRLLQQQARVPVTGRLDAGVVRIVQENLLRVAATTSENVTYWTHGGSIMALISSGNDRRFVYHVPPPGARVVTTGTVRFEGRRDRQRYVGRASDFSSQCGVAHYDVAGPISANGREVRLQGRRPVRDTSCQISTYADVTLVFTLRD